MITAKSSEDNTMADLTQEKCTKWIEEKSSKWMEEKNFFSSMYSFLRTKVGRQSSVIVDFSTIPPNVDLFLILVYIGTIK